MRIAMYYSNNDVRIEELPQPEIKDGEILIKIRASGICGTDVLEWYRRDKIPLVLGHEIAGEIVKTGKGVENFNIGDRVTASHHVPCNQCHYCKDGHHSVCDLLRTTKFYPGGFAEYVKVPAINIEKQGVYLLNDKISDEQATFIEPLACVIRGQRFAKVNKGKTVLILGSGVSGILHIRLARYYGVSKIIATDIVDYRLDFAKKSGADEVVKAVEYNVEYLKEINNGRLADTVIICAGAASAVVQAVESVDKGGRVLFFAPTIKDFTLPTPLNKIFWRNETTLISSYAATPDEHRQALKLISDKKIKVEDMITHRLSLADAQEGFKLVAQAGESMKVVLNP